jgi:hypothetical protein
VEARNVIDYALQRRARLTEVASGRASATEVCDAHPYLLLAARHYGEKAVHPCPVCRHQSLRNVHYIYGDALGKAAGQAKTVGELRRLSDQYPEFAVYVVEVCSDCSWNHLVRSFVLGRGQDPLSSAAGS